MKIIIFLLVFYPLTIFAHQPKLINYSPSFDNPHEVVYPEISKAYYSKLEGEPHYYKINSDSDFLFYTGILSPKVNDIYKWLSLEVLDENKKVIYKAEGKDFEWNAWYEPYARDWYWKGPEIGTERNEEFKTSFMINAGTYLLELEILEMIPPNQKISIERDIYPKIDGNRLYGFPFEGYFIDDSKVNWAGVTWWSFGGGNRWGHRTNPQTKTLCKNPLGKPS